MAEKGCHSLLIDVDGALAGLAVAEIGQQGGKAALNGLESGRQLRLLEGGGEVGLVANAGVDKIVLLAHGLGGKRDVVDETGQQTEEARCLCDAAVRG